jgi:hypothetical protein
MTEERGWVFYLFSTARNNQQQKRATDVGRAPRRRGWALDPFSQREAKIAIYDGGARRREDLGLLCIYLVHATRNNQQHKRATTQKGDLLGQPSIAATIQ